MAKSDTELRKAQAERARQAAKEAGHPHLVRFVRYVDVDDDQFFDPDAVTVASVDGVTYPAGDWVPASAETAKMLQERDPHLKFEIEDAGAEKLKTNLTPPEKAHAGEQMVGSGASANVVDADTIRGDTAEGATGGAGGTTGTTTGDGTAGGTGSTGSTARRR